MNDIIVHYVENPELAPIEELQHRSLSDTQKAFCGEIASGREFFELRMDKVTCPSCIEKYRERSSKLFDCQKCHKQLDRFDTTHLLPQDYDRLCVKCKVGTLPYEYRIVKKEYFYGDVRYFPQVKNSWWVYKRFLFILTSPVWLIIMPISPVHFFLGFDELWAKWKYLSKDRDKGFPKKEGAEQSIVSDMESRYNEALWSYRLEQGKKEKKVVKKTFEDFKP